MKKLNIIHLSIALELVYTVGLHSSFNQLKTLDISNQFVFLFQQKSAELRLFLFTGKNRTGILIKKMKES